MADMTEQRDGTPLARPSGTVTFLFTDVEGSTKLWAADKEAMSASLLVHDAILRGAIEGNGGYVSRPPVTRSPPRSGGHPTRYEQQPNHNARLRPPPGPA